MNVFDALKEYEGMKAGLSRIKKFLKSAGNPQDKIKCVHIAGTNGKGSTAAFLASALKENGYKTALYVSPHLTDITERLQIDGKNISKAAFASLSKKYSKAAVKYKLSYFEYLTGLAFIYFSLQKADIAVIETGLGGRFDATNVIKKPLVSIIASIGLDHKEILGNTISKIAFEKAGIIKKNRPVICANLPKSALKIIKQKAKPYILKKHFSAKPSCLKTLSGAGKNQNFDYFGLNANINNVQISLLGNHQIDNAALALCALEVLGGQGYIFKPSKIKKALMKTKWAARLDIRKLPNAAEILIDGAHNKQAIEVFIRFAKSYLQGKKAVFIFAAMKEKEYKKIIAAIVPFAKTVILPYITNQRAVRPEILEKEILKISSKIKTVKTVSVKESLKLLTPSDKNISVGSLYLAGEILKLI
ncbi:MAG: bifunctional folylpolyglutamate synthase/dihydrofolate synthase [Endomicrobium sp.]|jgi:dihydrofolate synthase/folylpolyglutamate synthase|nr:bifunctional folylpolyglutamate synthase/dihydrofolate synthase [Endomicrobium sp.]